jgi:hypothetical protein
MSTLHHTETQIEVYKGNFFTSKLSGTRKNKHSPIVITFDLDETLGSFSALDVLWSSIEKYNSNNDNKSTDLLTQDFFNELLDMYPEFLRYGILSILEFLYSKKKKGYCDKIFMYTNNQCSASWCTMIARYFDYKLNTDSELFDQIVCAFKINNQIVELGRSTNNKVYCEFVKCTLLPKKTKMCFIDNTYFREMLHDRVFYIQPMSYRHYLSVDTILQRFFQSSVYKNMFPDSLEVTSHGHGHSPLFNDFLTKQFNKMRYGHSYLMHVREQDLKMNIFVAQKMMYYIKEFFYLSYRKCHTKKLRTSIGRFTRKRYR